MAAVAQPIIKNGTTASFKSRTGMEAFFAGDDASAIYCAAERLTGPVATPLIEHAGLRRQITRPTKVLDMACGTGVVSAHLHQALKELGPETQANVQLTCADISDAQIAYIRRRIEKQQWENTVAVQTNAEVCACLHPNTIERLDTNKLH